MKKNRKQWMKYAAVILSFLIMAGFFMPGTKTQVNATETEGSVNGGNVETEETIAWSIGVVYNLGAEDATWTDAEGNDVKYETVISPESGKFCFYIPEPDPVRTGYEFVGWTKEGDDTKYKAGVLVEISSDDTNENTQIDFTAQWQENPYVTILYKSGETTVVEEKKYRSDDAEKLTIDFMLDCFQKDPEQPGYLFAGWKCDLDGEVYSKTSPAVIQWDDISSGQIVFTMQWKWDEKNIKESGKEYPLKAGTSYTLDSGTWTVNSDGYSYTGGTTFYVGTEGSYTFTKN